MQNPFPLLGALVTKGWVRRNFAPIGSGGGGGSGTVTSVGLSAPAEFTVSGSPVTASGTLALGKASQPANRVYAGPTSGGGAAPAFRALVAADIPALDESKVTASAVNLGAALSGTVNIDLANGNLFYGTVVGATTFTVANAPASGKVGSFTLELANAGAQTITWTGGRWDGGAAPALSAAGTDIITGYTRDGGTTVRLFAAAIGSA